MTKKIENQRISKNDPATSKKAALKHKKPRNPENALKEILRIRIDKGQAQKTMRSSSNPKKSLFEISIHKKQVKSWKNHEVFEKNNTNKNKSSVVGIFVIFDKRNSKKPLRYLKQRVLELKNY
jgi:hypothetical protein